jgi:hypothetical protein
MKPRSDRPPADRCEEIVLADGNPYHLLRPTLEMVAAVGHDGRITVRPESPIAGYDGAMARLNDAKDDAEFLGTLVEMALALLRPSYDVTEEDVPRLFRFGAAGDDLVVRLQAHCLGRTPAKN